MAVFIGIDVSKKSLDIAARGADLSLRKVDNNEGGHAVLVATLLSLGVKLVVLEATGGCEVDVASALAAQRVPVAIVNPRQVRDFAKAMGKLAKTDTIDAQVLAHFAEVANVEPQEMPSDEQLKLVALVTRGAALFARDGHAAALV